ncbi:MAG TPA: M23 family metallopeptidase, partial [Spirochaetia bacterium]|nr:M23 family metallopeptidase [Spirochaetia bacterium]
QGADGMRYQYRGNRELLVNVGDRVQPGTEIARLGPSLLGGGTKLYFSINDADGNPIDPEKYFSVKSQS